MKTRIVTFPRSGHHWLVDGLLQANPKLKYNEHHQTGGTLENCDCDLQKTHDFLLDVPKKEEYKHVIQFRNPLRSVQSWYELVKESEHTPPYAEFFLSKIKFYSKWFEKWVMEPTPNSMIVCYEDMLKDYDTIVSKVLRFIDTPYETS